MPKKMKTTGQLKRIFGLAKPVNCSKEDLEELAFDVTDGRTDRLSKLYFDEANKMIERLGGKAFHKKSFSPSRRTVNHRKQKAGIKTIVSNQHLSKMQSEWFKKKHRTQHGLEVMCQRIIKKDKPRTAQECNKVIEAIKSMNKRAVKSQTSSKKEVA